MSRLTGMAQNIELIKSVQDIEKFETGWKALQEVIVEGKITAENAIDYIHDFRVYFNHKLMINLAGEKVIIQIADNNCTEVVKVIDHFLRTGEFRIAENAGVAHYTVLNSWIEQEQGIVRHFKEIENVGILWREMGKNERGIILCLSKNKDTPHHVLNVLKDNEGKVHFIEGQNFTGIISLKKDVKFSGFRYIKKYKLMLTEQEMITIAENYINKIANKAGIELSIVKESTKIKPYGMIFFYVSKEFYDTKDERYNTLIGNIPFVVENKTGKIVEFGSGMPIQYYIDEYEAGRWPNMPRLSDFQ